ncbi:transglycosylase SLT domain-containing protein [Acidiphilium sp. PA]|uniref:transglycosylase SLT domain-containing protein n=1 Tax=Acidiphilium sp. PA TaxID=2871705 RepID=UPI002243CDE3|nr:transglycosylase SLT domain-containing protein [Acidiphilium sp. PA]MCW8307305.1 transglycosylase SLT domain-containing protein [Acidiphilium sp. PA]
MTTALRRAVAILGLILLAGGTAHAGGGCRVAAAIASSRYNLPPGLLAAIGVVESGRRTGPGGAKAAWPDTVDADGQGHWFATAADAADFVRIAEAGGAKSIDVGCFQIDLEDHPDAFPNLATAFTPAANAAYAAAFLARLHANLGSWRAATAAYHSATPARGLPYAALVSAAWHGIAATAAAPRAPHPGGHVIHLAPPHGHLPLIITP